MASTPNSYSSNRSTPSLGPQLFDAFVASNDHRNHFNSTEVIRLDSGKLFCPLCLENRPSEDITSIEDQPYHKYIGNLFDVLDQYGEKELIRKIVLSVLEILLTKRPFIIRRDDQFHDLLRTVCKIMRSDRFRIEEFTSIAKIISGLSIDSVQPLPLKSAWGAWRQMLDFGEKKIDEFIVDPLNGFPTRASRFYLGLSVVIKTYLELVNRNTMDQVSDVIFPIYASDTSETLCRKYYVDSQNRCLNFMQDKLVQHCSYHLSTKNRLTELEISLISILFEALKECLVTALRINNHNFEEWLKENDFIARVHSLFNKNESLRDSTGVKEFIKTFVLHYIVKEYGPDHMIEDYQSRTDIVQTFGSRARHCVQDAHMIDSAIFYILTNCIASKHGSRYFISSRVKSVLSRDDSLHKLQSRMARSCTLFRAYIYVVSITFKSPASDRNLKEALTQVWEKMRRARDFVRFRDYFCYEEQVFSWAREVFEFKSLLNRKSVNFLVERSIKQDRLDLCLRHLMHPSDVRTIFNSYLKNEHGGMFNEFIKLDDNRSKSQIINEFNWLLPSLLSEAIASALSKLGCKQFRPDINSCLIEDLSNFLKNLYLLREPTDLVRETLIAAQDLIESIINSNHECLMTLIKCLNHTLFGFMYNLLCKYTVGDGIAESAAKVIVAYDTLDYPLEHRIDSTLYSVPESALQWMLSKSDALHFLSMKLAQRILSPHSLVAEGKLDTPTAISISTAVIHMLYGNPELVRKHKQDILAMLKFEAFEFNPMTKVLYEIEPELEQEIDLNNEDESFASDQTPSMSFESADSGLYNDDQISVSRILDLLHDEDSINSGKNQPPLPRHTFLWKAIDDPYSSSGNTQNWEKRAFETTQSSTPSSGPTQHTI